LLSSSTAAFSETELAGCRAAAMQILKMTGSGRHVLFSNNPITDQLP
jgi:hypothetical protein